jgi:Tfp pilus assembly protein PilW
MRLGRPDSFAGFGIPGLRRRGVLVAELMIGLVIFALVAMAIASIMTATAVGWQDQQMTQSTQMKAQQILARVQKVLAASKYIGAVTSGSLSNPSAPASVFIWQSNNFGGVQAEDPRIGEMAVISYDPATSSLYLYSVIPQAQMNQAQLLEAAGTMTLVEINDPSNISSFDSLDIVSKTTIGGPGSLSAGSGPSITGFEVDVNGLAATAQLPIVEFAIQFSQNGGSQTLYGTSTLWGPATRPQ